ncbi:MAG: class I SAM-dependent methyltransferase [Candidatus Nanoarchaeia archaeon]|nr:class I SAM-dependent methyltransferase [Candidatus Nanoarchaeia archaeon]
MKTREELVIPLIKNKSVLDLSNSWGDFKDLINKFAKSYEGVDIEKGTTYTADLNEPLNLKKTYEVIVAGELIEHIENTGIFLENVKKHLNSKGLFFLSTPNSTSFRFGFYAFFGKEPEYSEHIKYFSKDSLKLILSRYFKVKKIGFCNLTTNIANQGLIWKIKFRIENGIGNIIPRYSPNLYVICELKK